MQKKAYYSGTLLKTLFSRAQSYIAVPFVWLVFCFSAGLLAACQSEEQIISEPPASSSPVLTHTLRGFIDKTGKTVIKPQFITANSFHEGLAHVVDPRGSYIDKSGNFVIKQKYYVGGDFCEGLAVVGVPKPKAGWSDVNKPGGELIYGYIDKSGNMVIPPQFQTALDFSEGMAAAMPQNSKVWGFIDRRGKMVIRPRFVIGMDDIERVFPAFKKGVAFVTTESGPVCIDRTGKTLERGKSRELEHLEDYDEEGLKTKTNDKDLHGFMDRKDKLVIPYKFEKATQFCEGLALVSQDGNKWGFIDRTGRFVIPADDRYEFDRFSEGMCLIKERKDSDVKCGFIDKSGKLVVPPAYKDAEPFREGLAAVSCFVSDSEFEKIKLPFQYSVQGHTLNFPIKFAE